MVHSTQNVHSKVQMQVSTDSGGRSRSQHSQLGRSSRAMGHVFASVSHESIDCSEPASPG